jgi:predicted PurR-regulated permease PerM
MPQPERPDTLDQGVDAGIAWKTLARVATVGIFILLLCAFLDQARVVVLPIVSAVVVAMMLSPIANVASRYNVPSWLSAIVIVLLAMAFLNLALILLSAPLIDWIGKAPEIIATLKEKFRLFERPLAALRDLRAALTPEGSPGLKIDSGEANLVAPVLAVLTPAIGQLLLFFSTLFFVVWGRNELRRNLVGYFHGREARLRMLHILNEMERDLTGYLSIVAVIYLGVGVLVGVGAYLIGLPNAIVWGVLAFVLNFIPYVGPIMMGLVLFGVGLITFPTLGQALIAPALYTGLTTLEGHFVTPSIMGRRLTLNPLLVFLALAFWTWLWGPIGAFLAVPLLIVGLTAIRNLRPQVEVNLPG